MNEESGAESDSLTSILAIMLGGEDTVFLDSDDAFITPEVQPTTSLDAEASSLSAEPSSSKRRRVDEYEDEDEENCNICTEPWTSSGVHQISSITCGHLFGKSCLEKWFKAKTLSTKGSSAPCPNCMVKYTLKDIRPIWARVIKVHDVQERDEAIQRAKNLEIEQEKLKKKLVDSEYSVMTIRASLESVREELATTKRKLKQYKSKKSKSISSPKTISASSSISYFEAQPGSQINEALELPLFEYETRINIGSLDHNSRVMAYSSSSGVVLASKRLNEGNFGVVVVNLKNLKFQRFYSLHKKTIRDIKLVVKDERLLALTVSLDSSLKLSCPFSQESLYSFELPSTGWSCTFNSTNPDMMYAGVTCGQICIFNLALPNFKYPCRVLKFPEITQQSPIHSLYSVSEGLLGANLNGVYFWYLPENTSLEPSCFKLIESNLICYSLAFEPKSQYIAASFRCPITKTTHHQTGTFSLVYDANDHGMPSNAIFHSHFKTKHDSPETAMPRSILFGYKPCMQNSPVVKIPRLYFCTRDENKEEALIWDLAIKSNKEISLPARLKLNVLESLGPFIDFAFCPSTSTCPEAYLLALTETSIIIFRHYPPPIRDAIPECASKQEVIEL